MSHPHLDERDLVHLRRAIALSVSAVQAGNHPFGSVLVVPDGTPEGAVHEAENTVVTGRDVTGHAELNLVRDTFALLSDEARAASTLYTSCEPCAMCSGAIYWAGIGRVVFALSESALRERTGAHPANPTLAHPCRTVFADGSRDVEVSGPHLEADAAAPHDGFWT